MFDIIQSEINSGSEKMTFRLFKRLSILGETRFIERKSFKALKEIENDNNSAKENFAKQLSAFSNYEGGIILFGVANDGALEQGIERSNSKGLIREWLQDIVISSLSPVMKTFSVKEISYKSKFYFAIVVSESQFAPHQSIRDYKYYGKFESKTIPINGQMVRDIFSRKKSPLLEIEFDYSLDTPDGFYGLAMILKNVSNICAKRIYCKILVRKSNSLSFCHNEIGQLIKTRIIDKDVVYLYSGMSDFLSVYFKRYDFEAELKIDVFGLNILTIKQSYKVKSDGDNLYFNRI
jgi:hypothetical protein